MIVLQVINANKKLVERAIEAGNDPKFVEGKPLSMQKLIAADLMSPPTAIPANTTFVINQDKSMPDSYKDLDAET